MSAEALAQAVAPFLRAGGRFTWTEWLSLPPEVREVAADLGDQLEHEHIQQLGGGIAAAVLGGPAVIAKMIGDPGLQREVAEEQVSREVFDLRSGFSGKR